MPLDCAERTRRSPQSAAKKRWRTAPHVATYDAKRVVASAARTRRDAARHSRRCDDRGASARSVARLLPISQTPPRSFLRLALGPKTRPRTPTRRCGCSTSHACRNSKRAVSCVCTKTSRFRWRRCWRGWKRPASQSIRPNCGVIGAEIDVAAARLAQQIFDFAGEEFNIGIAAAARQSALRQACRFPGGKKNKTGWATGVEVLQGLAREYPICALVLEWREVTKLKNTYIDVIPSTGRFARRPAAHRLQSDRDRDRPPVLDESEPAEHSGARRTRAAHSARVRRRRDDELRSARRGLQPDRTAADGASLGRRGDARAFEEGQDIHDFTARQIFDVAAGGPRRWQSAAHGQERQLRFALRHVGFRIGAAPRDRARRGQRDHASVFRALSIGARVHRADDRRGTAQRLRLDDSRAAAATCPGYASGNYMLRAAAEREATNAPLQGSAADLMKLAMVRDRSARSPIASLDATMLLQIHDELIFEVRESACQRPSAESRAPAHGGSDRACPFRSK